MRGDPKSSDRLATTAASALVGATVVSLVMAGMWSAARSTTFDADIWRGAAAGSATITAFMAAGFLGMWWRTQLEAPALWWSLAIAAISTHVAIDLAAVLAEPGSLFPLIDAIKPASIALAILFALRAVLSPPIDLATSVVQDVPVALGVFALGGIVWWIAPSDWLTVAGLAAIAVIALVHGLRRRDNLAGWFAVGVLGVLHHAIVEFGTSPDAIVAVSAGIILELSLVLMLLGVFHHMEKAHVDLERRLRAATAREHLLKEARVERLDKTEQRLHETRSALAALDLATRLIASTSGSLPLRDAIRTEVAVLRRLVVPGSATSRQFLVADALVGAVAVQRLYGLDVQVDVPVGLSAIGDLPATAEVVQCLLENARVHASGGAIQVAAYRLGGEVHVSVSDSGQGIADGLAEQVFERGFTTGSGQGLGLAIASRAMADQGGRLWLDTAADAGARFIIALPIGSATTELSHETDDVARTADADLSGLPSAVGDDPALGLRVEGDSGLGI